VEVNIQIGFWTLKVKCTQYGFCGQAAFKNARGFFFIEVERGRQQFSGWITDLWSFSSFVGLPKGVGSWALTLILETPPLESL
jgi:hypothetical protein